MDTIVALGTSARNFAQALDRNNPGVYSLYELDENIESSETTYQLPSYKTHEEYDSLEDISGIVEFLGTLPSDYMFVLGSETVSGAALRVLEKISTENTSIHYIQPDMTLVSESDVLRHNVVFGVLQEYARSGVFKEIILIDNKNLEMYCQGLTMKNHFEKISELSAGVFHWLNIFKNTKPVIKGTTFSEVSRITTFGMVNPDNLLEKMFYNLEGPTEKHYYFGISSKKIESETGLLRKLKDLVKDKETEYSKVTFSVYSTEQEEDFCLMIEKAREVQKTN
jgi:hypothetical protein